MDGRKYGRIDGRMDGQMDSQQGYSGDSSSQQCSEGLLYIHVYIYIDIVDSEELQGESSSYTAAVDYVPLL